MTAIYVAARFDTRKTLRTEVLAPLEAAGHVVTSRWLHELDESSVLDASDLAKDISAGVVPGTECLDDIRRADVVAVFTYASSSTGGYHTECGYALGLAKPIADFLEAWGCAVKPPIPAS